jgi:glutamate-ammonia-ligase adenylyltransferase
LPNAEEPTNSRQVARDNADAQAEIAFRQPASTRHILSRVLGKVSGPLTRAIPSLLADSPDPDTALLLFDRLVDHAPPEVMRLLNAHQHVAHYALVVFGYSRFLGETLIQNPDLLQSFSRAKNLDQTLSADAFRESLARLRSCSSWDDISSLLARFKRREYVRIMLRDVLGIAPLAETTAEISALADVLIAAALEEAQHRLRERYSTVQRLDAAGRLVPVPFTVLSLGKLGGNELNYSSDVDLLYVFGDGEDPPDATISNREYFIRMAQHLTEILSRATCQGAVFRIDMRLRPQGSQGELAVSLSHALRYYATTAHDWERQALIKVRHSAGDPGLARDFLHAVQNNVYSPEINLAAIATALEARERIGQRRRNFGPLSRHPEGIDVKLDRGGIRDIEFLVQCLQRVYGGMEPWLRSGGTMFSLQKLHDKRHIEDGDFQELTNSYVLLRHVEHRLQLREGQQIHRLPSSAQELRILHRSLGASANESRPDELVQLVGHRMEIVADIYRRVIEQRDHVRPEAGDGSYDLLSLPAWSGRDQSNEEILGRLAADSPALYRFAVQADMNPHTRRNLFRFFGSALTGSERYAAVLRHSEAMPRAVALFESSDYLTDILIRHPEEIATLAEMPGVTHAVGSGYLFDVPLGQERSEHDPIFSYVALSEAGSSEKMALLRRHYRHRILASGARDVTDFRDVYESLTSTTAAAEDAITAALRIAGAPHDLAIMALGRLGSHEFDLLSDADLLFVCDENSDRVPLTKSAERVMQTLAAYTRDGMVFPVDTRLRPHGWEGELLVSPAQLRTYCAQEAQPWEALMYTKLRYLSGCRNLADQALSATGVLFQRFADDPAFPDAVREMRLKLEATETEKSLKTAAGAIYDIDFLSSFLFVKNLVQDKRGTLRDRLWRCAAAGLMSKADTALLDHAAELLRTVDHVFRLVTGRPGKVPPANGPSWLIGQNVISKILRREFPSGLASELEESRRQVRAVYERLLP